MRGKGYLQCLANRKSVQMYVHTSLWFLGEMEKKKFVVEIELIYLFRFEVKYVHCMMNRT